jgi:hypothetical protein
MTRIKLYLSVFICLSAVSLCRAQDPVLGISRQLLAGASYYEAVTVLEPLLLQEKKSRAQQEAYTIAEEALRKLVLEEYILIREYETLYPPGSGTGPGDMKWEKITALNRLGAGITYDHMAGAYDYHHDFLRALVKKYPESKYAAAARFYTIRPGINELSEVEREQGELRAYIRKYPGLKEADLARLKIARINDNLWDTLYHGRWPPFHSGDKGKDKARAEECRREAMKLYKGLLKSRHLSNQDLKDVADRYYGLESLKHSGRYYIISD